MNTLDKVAITSRSFSANKYLVEELRARYANITLNNSGKTLVGSELLEFLDGQNKVIVGLENFDKNLIDQLPELKVISKFGVGLNNIDLESMKEHSISLGFQPGTNKQSVAELALMHIFIALRKAPSSKEDICNNIWSQNKGHELFGKTIGIIGFGNIGQRLAELLEPFKCKIVFYDGIEFSKEELVDKFPSRSEDFINNLQQSSLNEVLKEADIVSIHIPLLEETQNLISVDELACLKKDVRIINTSRGGIVDEKALEDFLNQNKNAFAAFDVFETEPAFNHPLLKLNNFYATSHLGSMTIEGVISMGIAAINGLDENRIPL
jgi:D-3-phosphoglycerate dehydrogenase|tara:strand:+ start:2356 stop:3324 length:969 start_codon:yes stop_codon:yes gene_type:complete